MKLKKKWIRWGLYLGAAWVGYKYLLPQLALARATRTARIPESGSVPSDALNPITATPPQIPAPVYGPTVQAQQLVRTGYYGIGV